MTDEEFEQAFKEWTKHREACAKADFYREIMPYVFKINQNRKRYGHFGKYFKEALEETLKRIGRKRWGLKRSI